MRPFVCVVLLFAAGVLLTACGPPPPEPSAPAGPASAPAAPGSEAPGPAAPSGPHRAAGPRAQALRREASVPAPIPDSVVFSRKPADGEALSHLYATIVTVDGKRHSGFLRWGEEQAFWDDRMEGLKADRPYGDRQPEPDRPHLQIKIVGFLPIGISDEGDGNRGFSAPFGEIGEIRPLQGDQAEIVMKSGTKYRLDGGSSDIGASVHVDDSSPQGLEIDWRSIERVQFAPAPAKAPAPRAARLYGDVTTAAGKFSGFVQWDSQECLATDLLDGDTDEARRISLPMGSLRSIEKNGDDSARVRTEDDRELVLRGTNDVNRTIRGILVQDPRYGRVRISWEAFQRVDFQPAPQSVRRYEDYPPARWLHGTVTDREGHRWPGRIVFDLDETETWDTLDGARLDVVYSIPLERVRIIEPLPGRTTRVILIGGEAMTLGDTHDVNDKNAGVLILPGGGSDPPPGAASSFAPRALAPPVAGEHYVPWKSVAKIDLD